MSSGEDVTDEGGYYYKKEENNANISCLFIEIRSIVKAASDVYINADEKERCSVGMYVTDKSAVVNVSADVCN